MGQEHVDRPLYRSTLTHGGSDVFGIGRYSFRVVNRGSHLLHWEGIESPAKSRSYIVSKPFHLLTPAERTALRIAQNRAIAEKVGEGASPKPPAGSSREFVRETPEDRAKSGGVVRNVQR